MKRIIIFLLTTLLILTGCNKTEQVVEPSEVIYWGINDKVLYLSPTKQGYATIENTSLLDSDYWDDIPWYYDENGEFDWYKDILVEKISILNDGDIRIVPKSTAYWFICLNECIEILGLENIDTRYITSMNSMFSTIDVGKLDLSNFDTSNVTDMSYMFSNCDNLVDVNLDSFDTSNVVDMSFMFDDCSNLKSLDVSSFDTSNVQYFSRMFTNTGLTSEDVNVSNFDISKAVDISSTDDLFGFHL